VEDGGAGLIVQIRADAGSLRRGDRVVLVYFDEESRVYQVEKLPDHDEPTGLRVGAGEVGDPLDAVEPADAPRRRA
jgi:hypothetical protein